MTYQSSKTGAAIEAALDAAETAIQPTDLATTTTAGLMSAADKSRIAAVFDDMDALLQSTASFSVGKLVQAGGDLFYTVQPAGSAGPDYRTTAGGAVLAPHYLSAPLDYWPRAFERRKYRRAGRVMLQAGDLVTLTYGESNENDNTAALQALADRPTRGMEIIQFTPGILRHGPIFAGANMYWEGAAPEPTVFRLRDGLTGVDQSQIAIATNVNDGGLEHIIFDGNWQNTTLTGNSEGLEYDGCTGWLHFFVTGKNARRDGFDHDDSGNHVYVRCSCVDPGKDGFHNSGGSYANWYLGCQSSGANSVRGAFTAIARESPGGHVFLDCIASNSQRGFQIEVPAVGGVGNNTVIGCFSIDNEVADEIDGIGYGSAPAATALPADPVAPEPVATDPRLAEFTFRSGSSFGGSAEAVADFAISHSGGRNFLLSVTVNSGNSNQVVALRCIFAVRQLSGGVGAVIDRADLTGINPDDIAVTFERIADFTYRLRVTPNIGSGALGHAIIRAQFQTTEDVEITML